MSQLGLPFRHQARYGGDFHPAPSNAAARHWLAQTAAWPERRLVLWGGAGCGKTHLARLWAPGAVVAGPALVALPSLGVTPRLVIDDADRCPDPVVLLHLLNASAEAGGWVLLTAQAAPARWGIGLPDLASRLLATAAIGIDPPEDDLLRALLARLIAERQVAVPASVQDWLLLRLPRNAAAIREAVARLDDLSLARGQPVTRALARAGLASILAPGPDDETSMIAPDGFAPNPPSR